MLNPKVLVKVLYKGASATIRAALSSSICVSVVVSTI